jgi:hypothetical protein
MRRDVRCRQCHALLGLLNDRDRHRTPPGVDPISARIVTTEPGVRVFVDVLFRRVELHCPQCGACGRTFDRGKLRGVVPAA